MSALVILLIAAGAIAHSTWNLVVKASSLSGPAYVWMTALGAGIVTLPVAIIIWIADPPDLHLLLIAAIVSGVIHVGYFLSLQAGYRAGDVSVVYPLARGSGPFLSVLFAILIFGERPGLAGLIGAGAVVAGVLVIGFAGQPADGRSARAGVIWGLIVGVTIATYTLWDANAVQNWHIEPVVLTGVMFIFEGIVLTPFALRTPAARHAAAGVFRSHWKGIAVVSVLSPLSYILILEALTIAPVTIVAPAREVSVVLVSLAGWLLFKEPNPARRMLGSVIVLAGVALLLAD